MNRKSTTDGEGEIACGVPVSRPLTGAAQVEAGELLRRLKRGARALPLRLPFRWPHQLPRA